MKNHYIILFIAMFFAKHALSTPIALECVQTQVTSNKGRGNTKPNLPKSFQFSFDEANDNCSSSYLYASSECFIINSRTVKYVTNDLDARVGYTYELNRNLGTLGLLSLPFASSREYGDWFVSAEYDCQKVNRKY